MNRLGHPTEACDSKSRGLQPARPFGKQQARRTQSRVDLAPSLIVLAWFVAGCDKPKEGPKRSDDAAAHAHRYHPEVRRADAIGTPASAPARAGAVTQPSDINFGENSAIGCPVLFVNGESITVQDVLEPTVDDLAAKARTMSLASYRNYVFRTVNNQIDYLASVAVVYQEAKQKYSGEKEQKAFDKEADRLVKDVVVHRYGGINARYEAHLKSLDLTTSDIKARAKRQAMVMQFLHDQFKPLAREPSRRELLQYYQAHPDEFASPARAQLLLIDIPLEKELGKPVGQAAPAELAGARERTRAQLTRAREELDSGVEFAAVARKYSKGIRASAGGDWGEITPGSLTGRWAKAAEVLFQLKAGQISDIVDNSDTLFIVKCGKLTPAVKLTFEQAQEQIIGRLADEEFNRQRDAYVQQLLAKATVGRRQDFFEAVLAAVPRPAAPTAAPSALVSPPNEP